jgi:hypothetical protein
MWPETINEWLLLTGQTVGLLVVITGLVGKWLDARLNRFGERIEKLKLSMQEEKVRMHEGIAANKALIEKTSFDLQRAQFQSEHHDRQIVELREMVKSLVTAFEQQRNAGEQEVRRISESVTEIKTTVKLLLKKGSLE